MASYVFTLNSICGGGEHVRVTVARDGGASADFDVSGTEIMRDMPNDEAVAAILRMRMRGKTRLQARNDLQAGFTVTI